MNFYCFFKYNYLQFSKTYSQSITIPKDVLCKNEWVCAAGPELNVPSAIPPVKQFVRSGQALEPTRRAQMHPSSMSILRSRSLFELEIGAERLLLFPLLFRARVSSTEQRSELCIRSRLKEEKCQNLLRTINSSVAEVLCVNSHH